MPRVPRAALLPTLAMLLLAEPAAALQIVDARDGETALAKVSRQEVTRIAFERGRIRRITGNTGEFVLEKDDEQGQLFVRPIDPASTKPVNLFLSTDKSTVALLLQPVDMPSDSIVIRQARAASDAPPRLESASRHVRMVKNLLLALAQDALPEDMEVREVARELLLWPDTRFVLRRSLVGAAVVAEKFELTNLASTRLELAESDLFKRGVMGVSIERPTLASGESTPVFVIRERRSDD